MCTSCHMSAENIRHFSLATCYSLLFTSDGDILYCRGIHLPANDDEEEEEGDEWMDIGHSHSQDSGERTAEAVARCQSRVDVVRRRRKKFAFQHIVVYYLSLLGHPITYGLVRCSHYFASLAPSCRPGSPFIHGSADHNMLIQIRRRCCDRFLPIFYSQKGPSAAAGGDGGGRVCDSIPRPPRD